MLQTCYMFLQEDLIYLITGNMPRDGSLIQSGQISSLHKNVILEPRKNLWRVSPGD